jgi:hypothetical protein
MNTYEIHGSIRVEAIDMATAEFLALEALGRKGYELHINDTEEL